MDSQTVPARLALWLHSSGFLTFLVATPLPDVKRTYQPDVAPQAEAQARLPRAHEHTSGPGDHQAPARPRVASGSPRNLQAMKRRRRLSPIPGFRRRVPAGPFGLQPLPRSLLVRASGQRFLERAPARPRGLAQGRRRGGAQPVEATAARRVLQLPTGLLPTTTMSSSSDLVWLPPPSRTASTGSSSACARWWSRRPGADGAPEPREEAHTP